MFQIRLHGRGGQGVVTSAEMLSLAAFTEGHATLELFGVSAVNVPEHRLSLSLASAASRFVFVNRSWNRMPFLFRTAHCSKA